jgi:sugar/nucleoside kinase (ribokinase family)
MTKTAIDVLGIGNAIVDVISREAEGFINAHGLNRGAMTLIDEARAESLYAAMGPGVVCSGGCAGNTVAGVASLGGAGAYIGKVRDDELGGIFRHDIRSLGVTFDTSPATEGAKTARCLIIVTPDAQRTLNTYLGACVGLGPEDIDEATVAAAQVTYMEGYLWDPPQAKDAFRKAMAIAHGAGRKTALSLSDSFCVGRYRDEFRDLVRNHVDILFANEDEIVSLYQVGSFDEAVQAFRAEGKLGALTRSEKGSVIVHGAETHVVPVHSVEHVIDTTGAGDLYASGFLFGVTQGRGLVESARIASIAAAEIISHVGARPETSLKDLVAKAGL